MGNVPSRIPVVLLTGYLGSGKTTFLNRLLKAREMANAAVIINEFGEVGIDHLLIEHSADTLTLLDNGCLCCMVRDDLVTTLRDLAFRRRRNEIPAFTSVVIETSGLADPAPILHTLMSDVTLVTQYRPGGIVATVDAVNGHGTLAEHEDAAKQVAMADLLLLTKTDLVPEGSPPSLLACLKALNPTAPLLPVSRTDCCEAVLRLARRDILADPAALEGWLRSEPLHSDHHDSGHSHADGIHTFCIYRREPMPWSVVSEWLDSLAALRGPDLLRVKGIVNVAESPGVPIVVQGVQHLFHPPAPLANWPDADHSSRFVFITRRIERESVERFLHEAEQRGTRPVPA